MGHGADLNATDDNGNTALHLIFAQKSMKPLDKNTPHLLEVYIILCSSENGIRYMYMYVCIVVVLIK